MAVRRPGLSEVDRWWEKHNTWKNERRRDRRTFRDALVRRWGVVVVVVVVVVREGQLVLALDLCHLYSHQHQVLHLQCVCGYFWTNKRSLSANYGQFVDTKAHHSCRCWDPTYSPNIHGMTTTARFFVQTKNWGVTWQGLWKIVTNQNFLREYCFMTPILKFNNCLVALTKSGSHSGLISYWERLRWLRLIWVRWIKDNQDYLRE